jgi:hypothetical protein
VNKRINLKVRLNVENFLSGCTSGGVSKRVQLHAECSIWLLLPTDGEASMASLALAQFVQCTDIL